MKWDELKKSMLGRIYVIKTNVLLWMLFLFQIILIMVTDLPLMRKGYFKFYVARHETTTTKK